MIFNERHQINEKILLVRFFSKESQKDIYKLDDCYHLLKNEIIKSDEIGFEIIDLFITKKIKYTDSQYGYAGQNIIDGSEPVKYIGCNRFPDYISVEDLDDLLDNSWDVGFIDNLPSVRFLYLNTTYVLEYFKTHIELFSELNERISEEVNKRKNYKKLAIFM